MGKLIFITGGARSGKSSFAENLAKNYNKDITYIATLNFIDEEMRDRIKKHKSRRDERFLLVEKYKEFDRVYKALPLKNPVLFDCLTNMISNLLLENRVDFEKVSGEEISTFEKTIDLELDKLLLAIKNHDSDTILVSNELGMGLVPPYALGRIFRDIAGRANQKFAAEADEVYFLVSGIPMKIKGEL